MNLYAESLAEYLINSWNQLGSNFDGKKEARFIVQSLAPDNTFDLFSRLENERIQSINKRNFRCYFKVANALWVEWQKGSSVQKLDEEMAAAGGLTDEGKRVWIDEEDRLTWYRSRTAASEQCDGLIVVLVGLNHATDQGGLKDFHLVDENRIWVAMGKTFEPWLRRLNELLALNASDAELTRLDSTMQQLFALRPRRLSQLGAFFEREVLVQGKFISLQEISEFFLQSLPLWGIPPILSASSSKKDRGGDIKAADEFISHQRYKTRSGQDKDWRKIEKWMSEEDFSVPTVIEGHPAYRDLNEYRETLYQFIYEANASARSRLLGTDVSPLLVALREKEKKSSPSKSIPTLKSLSLEATLEAVWQSIAQAISGSSPPLTETINSVDVELETFQHDLVADDESGSGPDQLAKDLLMGCLGGLGDLFSCVECKVPADPQEARDPRSLWSAHVPVKFSFDVEKINYSVSRSHPRARFKVTVSDVTGETYTQLFYWALGPNQPERVRFECAKKVLAFWKNKPHLSRSLPAFQISSVRMTAIYFAADEEEANRLLTHAMTDLKVVDLLHSLHREHIDPELLHQTMMLAESYQKWLVSAVTEGFYTAGKMYAPALLKNYIDLAEKTLDSSCLGSAELLPRLYKSYLLINEHAEPDRSYLPAAIVWGLSPAMLELTQANTRFLCDGFSEIVGELVAKRANKALLSRLVDLGKIQRPLTALLTNADQRLSATVKSFGLIHYLGPEPNTEKSLAVQALLREEESDDDGDVGDFIRSCEEQSLVDRVVKDYMQLYPAAEDGVRILAVNVKELSEIISGIDYFLKNYLKNCSPEWPPFNCTVMVYSCSSSPMAIEGQLKTWRENIVESMLFSSVRPINLTVGHRYAPFEKIDELLHKEARLYDIAFLFHFLRDSLSGRADPALPFEFEFNGWDGLQFPIAEYPRPIRLAKKHSRQSLLSNRRLRIQTRHADLSARLAYSQSAALDHLIFGEVNYQPWAPIVHSLHKQSRWVACIDPFIDKGLLSSDSSEAARKIVGFSSGLGAYGELNVTISTEQDTLKQLAEAVRGKLTKLLPHEHSHSFDEISEKIVQESEEVIGLASLRAVVGIDEKIREVIGFAAIRRALEKSNLLISQLIPIDSLLHWYVGSEVTQRPDLLSLGFEVRENNIPLVHAAVIECKLANKNPDRLVKACDQVQEGLKHLTALLAPACNGLDGVGFDRRYWWAQLHRAITSRATVNASDKDWRTLELALEQLTEGQYEIRWQGMIFTFWTNSESEAPRITPVFVEKGTVSAPFSVPPNFTVRHVEYGHNNLIELFSSADGTKKIPMEHDVVSLCSDARQKVSKLNAVGESPTEIGISHCSQDNGKASFVPKDGSLELPGEVAVHSSSPVGSTDSANGKQAEFLEEGGSITNAPLGKALDSSFSTVPEKILIGKKTNGDPVYWHYGHPQLANRHLLLFGTSGSGKTYAIQCLLAEMANQSLHSFVVDYTDGFLPGHTEEIFKECGRLKSHFVVTEKLPLSPLRRQSQILDPSIPPIEENNYQVATRIQSIFSSVFELGSQQTASLIRAIQSGLEEDSAFTLGAVLDRLRAEGNSGETLANKLQPFMEANPFREADTQPWRDMLASDEHWINVLQLKGLSRDIQKAVTEFTLWDLWDYAQNHGSKQRPIPIVLDEIQNLDHSSDSPIDKMLREGRKFGLSLMLATQTTSQFDAEQRDRLFQAAHKLFFKPATTEIDRFAQILSKATNGITKAEWTARLAKLEKGQCWSLGPVLRNEGSFREEPVLVSVTSLESRFM